MKSSHVIIWKGLETQLYTVGDANLKNKFHKNIQNKDYQTYYITGQLFYTLNEKNIL